MGFIVALSNAVRKQARGTSVIGCWVCVAAFVLALGLARPDDKLPLDLLFFYTPQTAYSMIESYGAQGREAYRLFALTVDLAWPIVYTLALSLAISWLLQRGGGGSGRARFLNVLPFGALLFDLLENASIVAMLSAFPARPDFLAWTATAATMTKWTFAAASLAALAYGIFRAMRGRQSELDFKSFSFRGPGAGPRLIVLGAVHGNETCGTRAIQRVMQEIDSGALEIVAGEVTFVPITNPLAYARGERVGERNLNRNLGPKDKPADFEDRIANWLCPLLARHDVLLDLHSTRGKTAPFAMLGPRDNTGNLQPFAHSGRERALAKRLGVRRFVEGWLDTYAKGVERRVREGKAGAFNTEPRYGVGTTEYMRSVGGYSITLECGQHEDPSSPEVAYRAIHNTLVFLGLAKGAAPEVAGQYEALRIREVVDKAHAGDRFAREWSSFDRLAKGDVIATRSDGTVVAAKADGWILFPDAKAEPGHEWFYIAEPVEHI